MRNYKNRLMCVCVLVMCFLLSSCDAGNQFKCYENVKSEFPNAISIDNPADMVFSWVVVDSDSLVWFVRTNNATNANVSSKEVIFDYSKK